jgi:hypothetical protein
MRFNNLFWYEGKFMADQEVKAKPARYPMGTIKQARNTLARLTRDLLNGKIDREKYRAACYGLSVQCGLFKIETPEKQDLMLHIDKNDIESLESPAEREARMDQLVEEHLAWKAAKQKAKEEVDKYNEEFLKRRVSTYEGATGGTVQIINPDFIVDGEVEQATGLSKDGIIEKVRANEPTPDTNIKSDTAVPFTNTQNDTGAILGSPTKKPDKKLFGIGARH